ncbi:MAG: cation diffusion facilitator family transporter [Clostridiales bacterium]|nr:cation diffusion facilitator family transporter [Clostridiales bacterium]
MTKKLIKLFLKNKKDRKYIGYLSGTVGILINILLFAFKFIVGTLSGSIAITADAFNNLSDVGSSVVTIVGFMIADKPADKEHPFGHGRGEYIAGLIVSILVLYVGIEFFKSSVDKILHPNELSFNIYTFIVLISSILVKLWLGYFNKILAIESSSGALNATSFDSFSDVIITSTVVISILIAKYFNLTIDGYIGLLVSFFILYAGYNLIKDTISPLLGEAPDAELIQNIIDNVKSYDGILGVHDLIVHSYGAEKIIASLHAEVDYKTDILEAHELIDRIEMEVSKKLNIVLILHMDPVVIDNDELNEIRKKIKEVASKYNYILDVHDIRLVDGKHHRNIIFDVVLSDEIKPKQIDSVKQEILNEYSLNFPDFNIVISIDKKYTYC